MRNGFRKIVCLLLVALVLAIFVFSSGCGGRKTPVEIGDKEQILHKGNSVESEAIDPQIVTGMSEQRILIALFEGLVNVDPIDLHPVPGVAESWDISEDGLRYTFHLRKNARWSNGDLLTAQDFVFSYNRLLSRNLGAPYANTFYLISGVEDYHKGILEDFSQVGIKALDDFTLQVTLKEPISYFLPMIAHWSWYPVHKDTVLKYGKRDERGTAWTRAGNMVSNGPFKLKSWEMGNTLVVDRNPYYWDKDAIRLNEIHFHAIEDLNTEERAFRSGQLHITEGIPLQKVEVYKTTPYLRLAPFFSTYAYAFNTKRAPLDDQRIRQALNLAIDRQAIIDKVSHRGESAAFSFVPIGAAGYYRSGKFEGNVERAKELLAEAGYPEGKGLRTIRLLYNTSDAHRSIAEALQHMWKKNLNIRVELVNQEWKVLLQARAARDFDLIRFGWVGDYLDPNAFLEIFKRGSTINMTGWANPDYDNYIIQANSTKDQFQRFNDFDKAETILMDELPVMPIYFYNSAYLVQPSVKNWHPNLLDIHPYNTVYLDSEGV